GGALHASWLGNCRPAAEELSQGLRRHENSTLARKRRNHPSASSRDSPRADYRELGTRPRRLRPDAPEILPLQITARIHWLPAFNIMDGAATACCHAAAGC